MNRAYFIIPILVLLFSIGGCAATLAKLDGSTKEELEKFRMSKDQVWNERQALKAENQTLQNRLNILGREQETNKALHKQVGTLKGLIENEKAEKRRLEKK